MPKDKLVDGRPPFSMFYNDVYDTFSEYLSNVEWRVYTSLCRYANSTTGQCFPSYSTIQKKTHVARHAIKSSVDKLVSLGLIKKTQRKSKSGGLTSNLYTIVMHPLPPNHTQESTDVVNDVVLDYVRG